MKTYQQLANHIKIYGITRGKTKGNAPVNRVAHSAREFIRYENGEGSNIVGYQFGFDDKYKVFTMTPEGVLTVHKNVHSCPSEYNFLYHAVDLSYTSKTVKGESTQVVTADGKNFYRVHGGMVFNPDGTCRNPVVFMGVRVDKVITAQMRANLKPFMDMYVLWFTPDTTRHAYSITSILGATNDTEQWEALCMWLKSQALQKWNQYHWSRNEAKWNDPKAHVKEILQPLLTQKERYTTGVYEIPVSRT